MTLNMPQTNQRLDTAFDIQPTTKITNNDNSIIVNVNNTDRFTDEQRAPNVEDFGGQGVGAWVDGPAGSNTCNDIFNDCPGEVVDCHGDCGGTAFIDACLACVSGNTGNEENYLDVGCGCNELAPATYCLDDDGDSLGNVGSDTEYCLGHGTQTDNSTDRPPILPETEFVSLDILPVESFNEGTTVSTTIESNAGEIPTTGDTPVDGNWYNVNNYILY